MFDKFYEIEEVLACWEKSNSQHILLQKHHKVQYMKQCWLCYQNLYVPSSLWSSPFSSECASNLFMKEMRKVNDRW